MATDTTGPSEEIPGAGDGELRSLGIGHVAERAYRALLRSPGSLTEDLSDVLDVSAARVDQAMASLEEIGLVSRTPGVVARYLPAAPDIGLEALILSREAELGQVRTLGRLWMAEYLEGQRESQPELFEVVTGSDAVLRRFDHLQRSAAEEVQVLDTPPYASSAGPATNDLEFELLDRGVSCRAVYDRKALEQSPGAVDWITRYVEAGEQARVSNRLPFKLATFDRRLAFVPHSLDQPDVSGAIVVHRCALLDMLLYIFDEIWAEAIPIMKDGQIGAENGADTSKTPGPDERRLLALLASGMTDQAVSRHLGWSYRTTRRRIAALMSELGAENRFQAGLAAARAGWF